MKKPLRTLLASLAVASAAMGCGGGGTTSPTTAASIDTQPQDVRAAVGAEAVFSAAASGDPAPSIQSSDAAALTARAADTIRTRFGWVRGNSYDGGFEFLGIPFAKPPVGALRWTPPVDPAPWSSVLSTQAFRPACPQMRFEQGQTEGTPVGDEDCLQLNVWTPADRRPGLPVLVFIHGGGQQQGSAGEISAGTQMYNGRNMAARGPAVVVTIQYRLGPLGYLVHPGLERETATGSSGNYGVMDQIQALKWVHDNIAAFGGDPTRVMVFGESAGGVNVGNLLTTPMAKGLFQRAGIESAAPAMGVYADVKAKGIDYVNGFVATGGDAQKMAAMRALDWHAMIDKERKPVDGGVVQMAWQAVVDGFVFKTDPATAFSSGQFNHVPLLIGSNADEMSLSAPAVVQPAMVTALVTASVPKQFRAQALRLYPPGSTPDEARNSYVQLLTDAQFTSTVRRAARAVAPQQSEPVWRYFFSHQHAGPLGRYGSYHGIELFYLFNNWENTSYGQGPLFTADDAAVQSQSLAYWVHFARTGNPNAAGLVAWPRFAGSQDCYLDLKAASDGGQCGLRTEKSDFWDMVSSQR